MPEIREEYRLKDRSRSIFGRRSASSSKPSGSSALPLGQAFHGSNLRAFRVFRSFSSFQAASCASRAPSGKATSEGRTLGEMGTGTHRF
jgi:hypothetical protein